MSYNLSKPKKLSECTTDLDVAYRDRYLMLAECDEFRRRFGVSLKKFFTVPFCGFDIVEFATFIDADYASKPDVSVKDILQEKYGDDGVKQIERLLWIGEEDG